MTRVLVVLALLVAIGCSEDQDPGIVPPPVGGSNTTSQLLGPCPAGDQPDDTTPPAGCLDADGNVVVPD